MGTSSSTKKIEKALNDYPEMSKEERKALIVSLKSSADRGCVRKEIWIDMIKDKGVPLGLAEALWNTFDRKRDGFGVFLATSGKVIVWKRRGQTQQYSSHPLHSFLVSFDLFDVECTESITEAGIASILAYCYEYDLCKKGETITDEDKEQIQTMASLVFKLVEKKEEGAINRQEFLDGLRKHEEIMKLLKKF